MRWLGVIVCLLSGYRLAGTPLQSIAWGVATLSVSCVIAATVLPHDRGVRLVTALQHVSMAMGGFLLFVSFAMKA